MDEIDLMHAALRHMYRLLFWAWFMVFHLGIAVAATMVVWWRQLTPDQAVAWLNHLADSKLTLWAGIVGVSALGAATLYLRIWRAFYRTAVRPQSL